MSKKSILVSGIQPSGKLHLGNYLGALKNFVALQNSGLYECFFFVADLHSLTEPYAPSEKRVQIADLVASFVAAGLNPKKSVIFLQSDVPAHAELAWILETLTPMGELSRMTQYKEKSGSERDILNMGLFAYPVLMASDILLYDAKFVPVGEDQLQHLELTRALARKFNSRFGKTLVEPKALLTESPRVMSLANPSKKMSKSTPKGCIFLDDSPAEIKSKCMTAVTDSETHVRYAPKEKPAVSNLLEIFAAVTDESIFSLEKRFEGKGYGDFKSELAQAIAESFSDFRKKKAVLIKSPAKLKNILAGGAKKATTRTEKKLGVIKKKIGIAI